MLDLILTNLPYINSSNQQQVIKRASAKMQRGSDARKVFEGVFFCTWQWQQQLYDGSFATFESLSRPDTVTVLAFDENGQVIMTKQSQPSMQDFWSMPGGVIDAGEKVWSAAKRELLEETGYASIDWYFLFSHQMNNRIDWANFYLVAKNCRQVAALNPDAGEKITVHLLAVPEFEKLINDESFRHLDFALWWWRGEKKIY